MALLVIDKGAETVLRYTKPKCLLHRPDAASPFGVLSRTKEYEKSTHLCNVPSSIACKGKKRFGKTTLSDYHLLNISLKGDK